MHRNLSKIVIAIFICMSPAAKADGIGFAGLTEGEFKDIISEFGAGYLHTSVSGASSLGRIFGFEVGLVASGAKADTIERISKEQDPSSDFNTLPSAALFGAVTFPYGITGEINFLPEINSSDVDFKTGSLAVKWTATDIWPLPVELSVKLHAATSSITWNQDIVAVPTDIEYEQTVSGLLFQVSKKFTIFEPYASLGTIRSTGELAVKGAGTVFDAGYTSASSSEEKVTGTQAQIGINFNFGIFKLGLEAGQALGSQRASLKSSFYF